MLNEFRNRDRRMWEGSVLQEQAWQTAVSGAAKREEKRQGSYPRVSIAFGKLCEGSEWRG